jgi:hypothetical protein
VAVGYEIDKTTYSLFFFRVVRAKEVCIASKERRPHWQKVMLLVHTSCDYILTCLVDVLPLIFDGTA